MEFLVEWIREDMDLTSIVVRMTMEEVAEVLASFEEASASSPSATDSRAIARPIAIALKKAMEER